MLFAMVISAEGDRDVLSLDGWRHQGGASDRPPREDGTQTISQAWTFLGVAFSSDGVALYASGGNEEVI